MVDISALNSKIKFDKTDVPFEQRAILGDATETGLARFAGRSLPGLQYDEHQKKHGKVFEVPFNSNNKWALVIVSIPVVRGTRLTFGQVEKEHKSGVLTSYIKGAPEVIQMFFPSFDINVPR